MEWASTDLVGVITFLLPGFLAAWVFYGLTAHPKRAPFERVVQALIFTCIVQGLTAIVQWSLNGAANWFVLGSWTRNVSLVWSNVNAVVVGLVFALFSNRDWFHRLLRWAGITKRTSHPSEWFSAFNCDKRYVILHLKGDRRLYGWPQEWPDQSDAGHFVIDSPEWVLENNESVPLHLVDRILIPATEVEMVEFMRDETEVQANQQQLADAERILVNAQGLGGQQDGKQSTATITQEGADVRLIEHQGVKRETRVKRVEATGHVTPAPTKAKLKRNSQSRKRRR